MQELASYVVVLIAYTRILGHVVSHDWFGRVTGGCLSLRLV